MSPSFGIPQSERRIKALIGPLVKTGEKGTTRDGGQTKPIALEYFKVVDSSGEIIPEYNDRPEELAIELVSDNPEDFFRDQLTCYDGKSRFCFNDSGTGTALRRSAAGIYQPVECNPQRCVFRLNEVQRPGPEEEKAKRLSPHQVEIEQRWCKTFDYAHLNISTRCKSQTYFLFALPHPTESGKYITRPGEFARYGSQSRHINAQLLGGLKTVWDRTQGRLKGLRVKLVMTFTGNAWGHRSPTVGLVGPTDSELPQAIAEMSKRRAIVNLDMDAAMSELAKLSQEDLALVDADYLYEHFYLGETATLPRLKETLALPAPGDRVAVNFGTDDPLVAELIETCRLDYAGVTRLQMRHGANVNGYVEELKTYARTYNIDISEMLARKSPCDLPPLSSSPSNPSAPAPSSFTTEESDAEPTSAVETEVAEISEFTEIPGDPTEQEKADLFSQLKEKYGIRQDS
jgi:hypothetical protein